MPRGDGNRIYPGRALTSAERQARHAARYPEAMKGYKRKHRLKKQGFTLASFAELLAKQGGHCALCQHPHYEGDARNSLVVDHCHDTGRVRGLLCHSCNRAIGLLKNDPEQLRRAADYLEKFSEVPK